MKNLITMLVLLAGSVLAADKPNIVLILADDLGWTGLGCYGSDYYETPNIDALAKSGMRFDNSYANAVNCAPSRASLMSGQYCSRHHIFTVGNYQDKWKQRNGDIKRFKLIQPQNAKALSNKTLNIAESLKKAGYRTGMFGKWHLGRKDQHPGKRGFDVAIESHGTHFGFKTDPPVDHPKDQYLSDFLTDHAIKFIESSHAAKKPFFLYFPNYLVHAPLQAKKKYLEYFKKKKPGKYQKSPVAAAMIKALDDSVGRVVDKLKELGIDKNTLVIFTSDNGGLSYEEDGKRPNNTSNYPLRARKGSEFEGGMRVPFICSWPGRIPANTIKHDQVVLIDLYPTFLNLTGAPRPQQPLDGVNLIPILTNKDAGLAQRELFWYLPFYSSFNRPAVIVRRGPWKLIHLLEPDESELYHTGNDIGEKKNVAQSNPELTSKLKSLATKWMDETKAPRMVRNETYDSKWKRTRQTRNTKK